MADYLYGAANVRALEHAMIGRERLSRLMEAKTLDEAYAMLSEYGVRLLRDAESGVVLREDTLLGILRDAYKRLGELAPDSEALRLWRYPYDCNNVKAVIKCRARGIDPLPMTFDFGTVEALELVQNADLEQIEALPAAMRTACGEAVAAFAKTKNPQVVDLILDRACYADMLRAAKAAESEMVLSLVTAQIDLTNVMMLLRVLRMQSGEACKALLASALLEGGSLSKSFFEDVVELGEDALWTGLRQTAYAAYADAFLISNRTLTAAERLADDYRMNILRARRFDMGALETMVAFLLGHEYAVRNLRILLSGKEAGLDTATIRERIRESYV